MDQVRLGSLRHVCRRHATAPLIKPTTALRPACTTSPGTAASRAEVDALAERLGSMDATIESGPADQPDYGEGYCAVFFLDPDGIKLDLAHTPAAG